ncbi:N-acetylmuramoyl-L-alanine amidase [Candidatus Desantisbacteria bacterium]|nr:N-acetylmuramoyl-L-alanine amidase [Candidatus Desantisbacteria bacterium]
MEQFIIDVKKRSNIIIYVIFMILAFVTLTKAYEITISIDEGHFIDHAEIEEYDNKEYISIDDVVRVFRMVKYWHPNNQKLVLEYEKYSIEMIIDNTQIIVEKDNNKKIIEINDPPLIINGKIMVPMTFVYNNIASMAGKKILWDQKTKTLKVNKFVYNITNLRAQTYKNFTRIAIDIAKEMEYRIEKQISTRLSVIIPGGIADTLKCKSEINDALIKEIISFQNKDDAVIYIDFKDKASTYKSFLLTNPYRIVIDISGGEGIKVKNEKYETTLPVVKAKDFNTTSIQVKEVKEVKEEKQKISSISGGKQEETNKKISIIVLDPGHGGKDPGAIGPSGLKEKDVVLKIAKELKNLLVKHLGTRVILTREGDYFVSLEGRTHTANFNHADLFISIHTNASFKARSQGFEVFYFAAGMNIDPYALAVVMKENSVMQMEEKKSLQMSDIDIIVYDILQTEYVKESKNFAAIAQRALDQKLDNRNRGIKQGPFFVLRNARMPSVLVEASFITNRKDEENLKSNEYISKIARALYDSVIKYKKDVER